MEEPKRISVEVADELYRRIKILAATKNLTLRKMITRWLLDRVIKEEGYLKKEEK